MTVRVRPSASGLLKGLAGIGALLLGGLIMLGGFVSVLFSIIGAFSSWREYGAHGAMWSVVNLVGSLVFMSVGFVVFRLGGWLLRAPTVAGVKNPQP